ncbi:nucleoside deaminase [Variovorax rhizosphaerae]|uniref:Nucleoside deaminase n=1 Tax=Variovorax rhizosphaerae TaxID=1836200 RepID=A0ABU8WHJ2_9BURK
MIDKLPATACTRRVAMVRTAALAFAPAGSYAAGRAFPAVPDGSWYQAAAAQKSLAESWGDQPYGAVVVLNGTLAGEGPSRVVKDKDINAHAERVAIRDAQRRLGRADLAGSVLYSTSRPCALCEAAAARAGVSRMYFGPALMDAGPPRSVAQ